MPARAPRLCVRTAGPCALRDRWPGHARLVGERVAIRHGNAGTRPIGLRVLVRRWGQQRELAGEPITKSFKYHDLGSAAYIARGRAVVPAGRYRCLGSRAGLGGSSSTSRS
jgi:hypothetical protein